MYEQGVYFSGRMAMEGIELAMGARPVPVATDGHECRVHGNAGGSYPSINQSVNIFSVSCVVTFDIMLALDVYKCFFFFFLKVTKANMACMVGEGGSETF